MQGDMAELQSCYPWNSLQLIAGALHDDTILVEIHITSHIGDVSDHALLVNDDFYPRRALEYDFIVFYKRNLFMFLKMILVKAVNRIPVPLILKQQTAQFIGGILFIPVTVISVIRMDIKIIASKTITAATIPITILRLLFSGLIIPFL